MVSCSKVEASWPQRMEVRRGPRRPRSRHPSLLARPGARCHCLEIVVDTEQLSPRRRRATALIALAVLSIAAASIAYLYSNKSPNPQVAPESNDPLLVTRDYVTYNFISPTEGWALDILPNTAPTPGQFAIFRTVDRGKHWQKTLTSDGEFFNYGAMPVQTVDAAHSFILVRG